MERSDSNRIHSTAIVDADAELGKNVEVGAYSIIEGNAKIGDDCRIASSVLIAQYACLGDRVEVHKSAVVGSIPQDLKFGGEKSDLIVGNDCVIREFCTLNRGTGEGGGITSVGSGCLLMAYSHVAHDCYLGDNIIMANSVNMAGHVTIEDNVIIGGLSVMHQFCLIGQHAFIGGLARVSRDVPPYIITVGDSYNGVNSIGLKRRGFTSSQVRSIKNAYSFIYRKKLNLTQAVRAIHDEMEITEEVGIILDFIERSDRGLVGI